MANHGKPELRSRAVQLRVEGRLSLLEIAIELGVSVATCSRWLKHHPLTAEELRARSEVGFEKLKGKVQSQATIQKRINTFQERIRSKSWKRFQGPRSIAKAEGKPTYVSENPCKKGHTERYTSSKLCTQCQFDRGRSLKYVAQRLCVGAKSRAKKDNIPFNLTTELVQQLWPVGGLCPILNLPLELRRGDRLKGPIPMSPTLDRIIPEKGYTQGNVAIISARANTLKNDCTDPAIFRRLADWLEAVRP